MKNDNSKLSLEQIRMISNALDINEIKSTINEDKWYYKLFCLLEELKEQMVDMPKVQIVDTPDYEYIFVDRR